VTVGQVVMRALTLAAGHGSRVGMKMQVCAGKQARIDSSAAHHSNQMTQTVFLSASCARRLRLGCR
jgi:hypothetical protein